MRDEECFIASGPINSIQRSLEESFKEDRGIIVKIKGIMAATAAPIDFGNLAHDSQEVLRWNCTPAKVTHWVEDCGL